jgi:heparosan-N-sulfate-glucuronate 5-epimerase
MNAVLRRLSIGFSSDWSHRRRYDVPVFASSELPAYYICWDPGSGTYGESWIGAHHDGDGVLCDSPGSGYFPIRIAQYALSLHRSWCVDRDLDARSRFLLQARWLRDSQQQQGEVAGLYRCGFAWKKYDAGAGWCSAMAQGEAISVLLRAARMEPDSGFEDAAERAAEPFKYPIEKGGVTWSDGTETFFEEVANEHAAHILNGCIYAFWGLWEYEKSSGAPWAAALLERAAQTLLRWLPRYDTGWWSRYSLMLSAGGHPHVATLKYHAFHIAQLRVLSEMLKERQFGTVADRWESYIDDPASRRKLLFHNAVSIWDRALRRDTVGGGASCDRS